METSPSMHAARFRVHTREVEVAGSKLELPAGTVTFLLTDVEGSTRLWQQRSEEMGPAIAQHYAILDEAITAAGGVRPVEQGEGDSVVGAFARASDAVAAAVAAQLRLAAELPLFSVRMAVHTGEAALRGEDNYVGRTIIRCARLRACAHGGQVLVSETTAALVAGELPEGVSLRDLGSARLRDLSRSERVWQIEHEGMPSLFPPLRSLDAVPHNLPVPLTSFIGRDAEQAVVAGLIGMHRMVTLTGSGGSGKTRLALHAAADVISAHTGGTWWVELGPVTEPSQVGERVAMATGFMPSAGVDAALQVVRNLADAGPVLMVLDNAEHVLDEVARISEALLSGCPDVRLVITSREPIGVPGEVVWRVPSLSMPDPDDAVTMSALDSSDAVRLFVERARMARPNLVLDDAAARHVASICVRLDGVPLALELAAARVRTLPLDRLAAGLDDAFRLLTGGARTVMARQQTLLASIAWSVNLLDELERAVLRRLAVFPTTFTLDAAEAVAADGTLVDGYAVLDLVGRLVDKSLVQLDDATGRYRMLETIRQYCMERLQEGGDAAATRLRLATYYARWCQEVGDGRHGIARGPLRREMPNVGVAMEWARVHDHASAFAMCRGLTIRGMLGHYGELAETATWLTTCERDGALAGEWAAAAASMINPSRYQLGMQDLWRLRKEIEQRAAPGDELTHRRLAEVEAANASFAGNFAPILRHVERLVEVRDDLQLSAWLGYSALILAWMGHLSAAEVALREVRALAERHGLPFSVDTIGNGFTASITVANLSGRFAEGQAHVWALLPEDGGIRVTAANALAMNALLSGSPLLMKTARRWTRRPALLPGLLSSVLALEALAAGDYTASIDYSSTPPDNRLGAAFRISELPLRNVALIELGRIEEAVHHASEAQALVDELADAPMALARVHLLGAQVALAQCRDVETADAGHRLLDIAVEQGYGLLVIDALEALATVADRRGTWEVASQLLGAARAERDRTGYRFLMIGRRADYDALVARTAVPDEPLSVDAAVEYARRARGKRGRPTIGWDSLTPTERAVVDLVVGGASNAAIAKQLLMGEATVKTHLSHVFRKLDVANRAQLAAFATRNGG